MSSWPQSINFVKTGWLSIMSSLLNIGCKLVQLLHSQVQNILNSSRNWSAVTSLMTSSWRHSIYYVNTDWVSTISSLVKIRWEMVELLCLQAQRAILPEMTSLMTSSLRNSIGGSSLPPKEQSCEVSSRSDKIYSSYRVYKRMSTDRRRRHHDDNTPRFAEG